MSLPEHENPRPERTASAPYNFVPLPEVVIKAVDDVNDLPDHDTFANAKYPHTGYFDVTLTTKSPVYVRCPFTLREFLRQERNEDRGVPFRDQIKNTPDFFYTRDPNQPVIPGSSLRGMLRGALEIVSYGKMERVTDSFKVTYRAVAAGHDDPLAEPYRQVIGRFGRNVRGGYLVWRSDGWHIRPAKKPADLKLPNRDLFLKIKEREIPNDVIPNYVPLNSNKYTPQYHEVTFDALVRKDKQGRPATRITNIGTVQTAYSHRGWLVCSGNMLETGSDERQSPRTSPAIVLEADDKAPLLKIRVQSVSDYLDALTPFNKEPPFDEKMGCLVNGRPVFYVERAGEVLFFGHCPNFRIPALLANENRAATPFDLVPGDLRRPEDIDYAGALFGYTNGDKVKAKQGDKARAYASRVFVTNATLNQGSNDIWFPDDPIVIPKILAGPKPTAFQHYLTQQDPNNKDRLDHYGSPPPHETVIRGHKRYWHQNLGTKEGQSLERIRAMIEEERETLRRMADDERKGKGDTQHTQFKPVKPEVTFTFRVYFENLSERELGALCWTLHPLGDGEKTYCHSLGMGKPLGMGAVKLDATLHLTKRANRYGTLFDGDNWQTGAAGAEQRLSDRPTLGALTHSFEQHVLEVLGLNKACQRLSELKRIGMLLKMMEWPGFPAVLPATPNNRVITEDGRQRPNTRYMTIQPNEYRDRFVLPSPAEFGDLTGDAVPTVANEPSVSSTALKNTSNAPQEKKPSPGGKTGGAPKTAVPKSGELVRCILLEEKTKKGGWKAKLKAADGVGAVLPGNEPLEIAPGQEVDLVVHSNDPKNMSFRWPQKTK